MKKGQRPSRHVRRVRTKYGRRRRLVNRKIRKQGNISGKNRALFDVMARRDEELGGYMDFNRKGLENVNLFFGGKKEIMIPENPDYEVTWHTHPSVPGSIVLNRANHLPSVEDVKAFLYDDKAQQAMIIFHEGSAVVLTKTPRTKKILSGVSRRKVDGVIGEVEKVIRFASAGSKKEFFGRVNKLGGLYSTLGLRFKFIPPKKRLGVPIRVIN